MKKLIYLCLFLPSLLMAQIPNAGFENWSSPNGVEVPDDWTTQIFLPATLSKTTDRQEGDFAVNLVNGDVFESAVMYTKFPVVGIYNKLTGYVKVDTVSGVGRAYIRVNGWAGGTYFTLGQFAHGETTDAFIPFEINFDLPNDPIDSLRIFVEAGPEPISNGIALGFSGFKLDNLKLVDSTTAVVNIEESNLIEIYPNPISDIFQIKSEIHDSQKLRIFDLSGRLVIEKEISPGTNNISVAPFQNGIYIVLIETEDGRQFRQKVVKAAR